MRSETLVSLALAAALCAGGLFARPAAAQDAVPAEAPTLTLDAADADSDGWIARDTELTVAIDAADSRRLSFVLDQSDLTDLFRRTDRGWSYRATELPLPTGNHDLVVYQVADDGGWSELARFPIQVESAHGFTERTADVNAEVQATGTATDDDQPGSERQEDFAAELQLGARARLARPRGGLDASLQLVGVSEPERALRAGLDENPDQLDLASYLVQLQHSHGDVSLGHTSYSGSRFLVDGFASRGLTANWRFGDVIDASAALLNGSQIVGWANPVGLDRSSHRLVAGGVGVELVPDRPGALRLDLGYLDGSVEPIAGFNQGVVDDAEESQGWSVAVHAETPAGRARFDGGYARSRFDNPDDPLLDQGDDLVPVATEERAAHYADLDLDLVRDHALGRRSFAAALSLQHQRVDPLFRSVGAFVQSDLSQQQARLDLIWGGSTAQIYHLRSADNLDDLPSILTTKTRTSGIQVAIPFADFASTQTSALPTFSLGGSRTTQEAEDLPIDGGFSAGHLPDQVSDVLTAGLAWTGATWQAGLAHESTTQDNRQPGREDDDFETTVTRAFVSWALHARVDLGTELSRERLVSEKLGEVDVTDRIGLVFAWRATERLTWNANLSWTDTELRPGRGTARNLVLDTTWTWRLLEISRGHHGATAQLYLRFASDDGDVVDRVFGFDQQLRRQTLVSGLTLSLR